jgi:hypothetical protein
MFIRREWMLNMEAMIVGLEVNIFEVARSLYVMDVSNTSGDTPEYKNFYDHHMILSLQYIGWAWWQWDDDEDAIRSRSARVRASRFATNLDTKVTICKMPFATISSDNVVGVGGTCVLCGCVPKNLLVYASKFSHEFEESGGFG